MSRLHGWVRWDGNDGNFEAGKSRSKSDDDGRMDG
jgi:hypothetical protein